MRTGARTAKLDFDTRPPRKSTIDSMEMYHPIGGKQAIKERKKERTVLAEKPVEKGELMGGNLAAEKEK